jgi:hypothetical protein
MCAFVGVPTTYVGEKALSLKGGSHISVLRSMNMSLEGQITTVGLLYREAMVDGVTRR